MSEELTLDAIDVDGAVRETAAEAMDALDGDTRGQFLRRAGLAGGAFAGGGAVLGALAPSAFAFSTGDRPPAKIFGRGDVAILRFALTLEYLEATFYNQATDAQRRTGFLRGGDNAQLRTFLRAVTDDENVHVRELKKALGSKALKKPKFDYHGKEANKNGFLESSFAFENEGVHAYSGQAFNIKDPHVLKAALSIVTVEARHAAVIGLIARGTVFGISPDNANDVPFGASRVLKDVTSLNFITKLYPHR
ncbi:MAG: ferritin-like domain-containing protein [Solirubrobacteraceae bacterium]